MIAHTKNRKLISADSANDVLLAKRLAQRAGCGAQQAVSGIVAQLIVDLLQAVHVGKQGPHRFVRAVCGPELLIGEQRKTTRFALGC